MVLRKPTDDPANLIPAPLAQAANNPPYPTTPTSADAPALPSSSAAHDVYSPSLHTSPAFTLKPLNEAQAWKKDDDSDFDDNSDWDKSDDEDDRRQSPEELPGALRIRGGAPVKPSEEPLPDTLRVGPAEAALRKSHEQQELGMPPSSFGALSTSSTGSNPLKPTNPYLRMQSTGQSQTNFGGESSAAAWGDAPSANEKWGAVELPTEKTPVDLFSKMSLSGYPSSPKADQPPLIPVESEAPSSVGRRHDSNASSAYEPGMDISSLDAFSRSYGLPSDTIQEETPQRTWQQQQDWEHSERERKQHELDAAHQAALVADQERRAEEDWHRGEEVARLAATRQPANLIDLEERPPPLPVRRSQEIEQPPPQPPRPVDGAGFSAAAGRPETETAEQKAKRQRTEHYQIKHIRWFDGRGIRQSPILTQNLNGPCPLLALVNALVLSTPASAETALIETLRTREQVSLGLLLDAVFDELMSGRRGGAAQELPDVSELYAFLVTLHTGMNVNPSFVKQPGNSNIHPALRRTGGFDDTREMRLYRTFNIPLIHGWLPPSESRAYAAFERIAKTHDDSQLVQFQEEELENKLNSVGLNQEEQLMFEDVHAIKDFLGRWPTQLTDYGLETMIASMNAGEIAILFRNDHFSTLYKEPRSGKLLTLVTDSGYSSHDEIIWESLVDVNGRNAELFSGDFRPVGGNHDTSSRPAASTNPQNIQSMLDVDSAPGWTTVQPRNQNRRSAPSQTTGVTGVASTDSVPPPANASRTEQEDHDLALALQLQEEEEDRHRRDVETRRRRENELSERAIAAHTGRNSGGRAGNGENPPTIPPRRNQGVNRPTVNTGDGVGENLPTYEEAATTRPYHPPANHPASPLAPVGVQGQQGSAYQANQAQMGGRRRSSRPGEPVFQGGQTLPGRMGRRTSGMGVNVSQGVGRGQGQQQQQENEKCVVM